MLPSNSAWYLVNPDVNKVGTVGYQDMIFVQVSMPSNYILSSILLPIPTMFLLLHLKCYANLTLYPNVSVRERKRWRLSGPG